MLTGIATDAIHFNSVTHRGVFASVAMSSLGKELTKEEKDAIAREVDRVCTQINFMREQDRARMDELIEDIYNACDNPFVEKLIHDYNAESNEPADDLEINEVTTPDPYEAIANTI